MSDPAAASHLACALCGPGFRCHPCSPSPHHRWVLGSRGQCRPDPRPHYLLLPRAPRDPLTNMVTASPGWKAALLLSPSLEVTTQGPPVCSFLDLSARVLSMHAATEFFPFVLK